MPGQALHLQQASTQVYNTHRRHVLMKQSATAATAPRALWMVMAAVRQCCVQVRSGPT